jgi:hypothetical protein
MFNFYSLPMKITNSNPKPSPPEFIPGDIKFDFVKGPGAMLSALLASKESGTAIGISAPVLGSGIFITAVEKILNNNDIFDQSEIVIVLKAYDITGYFFARNVIKLNEIKSVWPLKSPFKNPFYNL